MADYYFKMDDMAVGYQGKTLIQEHYKTIEINRRKGVLR